MHARKPATTFHSSDQSLKPKWLHSDLCSCYLQLQATSWTHQQADADCLASAPPHSEGFLRQAEVPGLQVTSWQNKLHRHESIRGPYLGSTLVDRWSGDHPSLTLDNNLQNKGTGAGSGQLRAQHKVHKGSKLITFPDSPTLLQSLRCVPSKH